MDKKEDSGQLPIRRSHDVAMQDLNTPTISFGHIYDQLCALSKKFLGD